MANDRSYLHEVRSAIKQTASRLFEHQDDVDVYALALIDMIDT